MKVIIAGGRNFNNYELLKIKCDRILKDCVVEEIISGKCPTGADALGEKYARERGYRVNPFQANWDLHGKSAGYLRNKQMAEYADGLIAFWDGFSKGTKMMIELAEKYNLKVKIIKY